ncbi:MAG: ABC transporter ATP-binding protein [Ruminococcus sp.]|jgi:spermidine/putrescine transport system ATP-binding protein|uniref:ABC transporter ATP-binding protein n=1 Tax=Blautia sp. TaxID=1955243 RepID=UPI002901CA1B|nr:ABC transporter ATP-binding protein [Ruminococcus sp.]
MSEISLELKNIKKSFQEGEDVLESICLTAKKGEFVTLLGSSGCGKTTTLRIIAGLEQPDSGQVFLNGKDVTSLEPNQRNVNTVFQNYALFPHMNVADNIGYGLKLKKTSKAEISRRVKEMLELVQLSGFEKRKPSELSGGQRQRVAIARALVNNPEVLLLDEPLGALDLQLRRAMQHELKRLQKKLGITFIYITHDQEEAINMSDTIAVMNHGRFEQIGTPDEIYNHPKTSYVAMFVGNANILTGVVESVDPERTDGASDQITVRTDAGKVKVSMNNVNITAEPDKGYLPQKGEKVTIAVRSENIRFEENKENAQESTQNYTLENTQKSAHESAEKNTDNSCYGLIAEVVEKTFAGGQLRVVLKTSEGQEIVASRYGIDTNVSVGEKVRCCFLPTDAVLVDQGGINA